MEAPRHISLLAINGLRGPGALGIAVGHFAIATDFVNVGHVQPIALLVDLFFVFSGLVIAQVYTETLSNPAAIPEYIIRRFGRIWPVHAATLAVLVSYELAKLFVQRIDGRQFSWPAFSPDGLNLVQAIPTNLLLVQSLGIHSRETWNYPSWSLSVEFVTYIVFALFCLVSPKLRRWLAVVSIAASLTVLVVVAPYHMRSTFDYGLFRCFAGFFAGVLCYEACKRWPLPKWRFPTLVEVATIALVIVWMGYGFKTRLVFAAPLVFCLMTATFVQERGLVSRVLLTKPFQILAELSFTIYMVHALILVLFFAFLHEFERKTGTQLFLTTPNPMAGFPGAPKTIQVLHIDGILTKWLIVGGYIACVLIAASAAYRFVEVPGRAFFGGIAKRFRARPQATPSHKFAGANPMEPAP